MDPYREKEIQNSWNSAGVHNPWALKNRVETRKSVSFVEPPLVPMRSKAAFDAYVKTVYARNDEEAEKQSQGRNGSQRQPQRQGQGQGQGQSQSQGQGQSQSQGQGQGQSQGQSQGQGQGQSQTQSQGQGQAKGASISTFSLSLSLFVTHTTNRFDRPGYPGDTSSCSRQRATEEFE